MNILTEKDKIMKSVALCVRWNTVQCVFTSAI